VISTRSIACGKKVFHRFCANYETVHYLLTYLVLMPYVGFVHITCTNHMELINRSDYSALDTIAMILKTYGDNFPALSEEENSLWAIGMIRHEVEQTGRTL
jgi:hypothetical protein